MREALVHFNSSNIRFSRRQVTIKSSNGFAFRRSCGWSGAGSSAPHSWSRRRSRTWFDYARDQGIATTNSTSAFPDVALTRQHPGPGNASELGLNVARESVAGNVCRSVAGRPSRRSPRTRTCSPLGRTHSTLYSPLCRLPHHHAHSVRSAFAYHVPPGLANVEAAGSSGGRSDTVELTSQSAVREASWTPPIARLDTNTNGTSTLILDIRHLRVGIDQPRPHSGRGQGRSGLAPVSHRLASNPPVARPQSRDAFRSPASQVSTICRQKP